MKIEIIKKTKDYLVINKPAGLAVHGVKDPSLADWLEEHYPQVKKVGDDPSRPGIVHRLDRDVSGLMVIALNQASFDDLKQQFQKRTVVKKYLALVYGKIARDDGEINFNIERSAKGYRMAAKPTSQAGKQAITEFTVIKRLINYTLVEAIIKTGRTHQIRAHFAAYNNPLVGDELYANKKSRIANKKINLGRVFLVAKELKFKDLGGKEQEFKIELPEELEEVLRKVK